MPDIVVEAVRHPSYLSNTFVCGTPGGQGVIVDAGCDAAEVVALVKQHDLTITHVLLTHHHYDHVSELEDLLTRLADEGQERIEVLVHEKERELVGQFVEGVTGTVAPDQTITSGDLELTALHTPGHTSGMLAFHGNGQVFTGDTLFKDSVGGVRAPDSTSFADLKHSVMEVLLGLPDDTVVRPGHMDPSTIGQERESNAFVRVWRGLDEEGDEQATVSLPGQDHLEQEHRVTLILRGADYDGGTKCWIRWPDGADDLVPGSKVS